MRARVILSVCVAALAACTGPAPPDPRPGPSLPPGVVVARDPGCPDNASCASGVMIGEGFFTDYDCIEVGSDLLGRLVAVGEPGLRWDRFRSLRGARTEILLAAHAARAETCPAGGWFVIQRVGPQRSREEAFGLHHDWCLVGHAALCTDRVLEWDIDSEREHIGYGYLPERIARTNAAVAAGDPNRVYRLDPIEVLRREPYRARCGRSSAMVRCRAGAWVTDRSRGRIEVTVLMQDATAEFRQYSSSETHFVLEQLGDTDAWWLVERMSGRYTLHDGRGEEARRASDARWDGCCEVILFDLSA